ncbi:hypothetical protein [Candidatus Avelusimicrobium luingense]|uniref:hypothetical protein n=1 Tax=Candidatus Avelusimicrobium luingense TaxID=3416211 RepID=UPI003D0AE757
MKKVFVLLAAAACVAACAKSNNVIGTSADGKTVYYTMSEADAANAKNGKYQIIDQEFDNMLAPDSDYDSLSDYELQACGSSYLPPAEKLKKPQAKVAAAAVAKSADVAANSKVTRQKKVTNTTNIYYVDSAPNIPASTTTTTTTYAKDGSVISTTTK